MDHRRFDQFARLLGGATTRRGALAALLALAGDGALDADAKRRRNRCDPPCPAGQRCVKGACACDDGGTVCGAACCAASQVCQGGACVDPLPQCLAFGATCKNAGVPCCDGLVCGSGQGGLNDVGCHVPAGGPCQSTSECVFGSVCTDGACVAIPQPSPAPACVPSFPVTGDPVANGRALQAAVSAANGGDTIVLGPGDYSPTYVTMDRAYIEITRPLTLKTCAPQTRAVIRCPRTVISGMAAEARCIAVVDADVTLDGIDVVGIPIQTTKVTYGVSVSVASASEASLTFRNGSVSGFLFGLGNSTASARASTVGPGVTIADCGTGLTTGTGAPKWSCPATVTWGSPPNGSNCDPDQPGCGC